MTTEQLLDQINAELSRLKQVRSLLSADFPVAKKLSIFIGQPTFTAPVNIPKKRKLSAKGLANIRAGVRKRWAKA